MHLSVDKTNLIKHVTRQNMHIRLSGVVNINKHMITNTHINANHKNNNMNVENINAMSTNN